MLLEFSVTVDSCWYETQYAGNVHNVSSTRVTEFDFLTENLVLEWVRPLTGSSDTWTICGRTSIYLRPYTAVPFTFCT